MKLLLDTCVWGGMREELLRAGHDVLYAADWPEDPGDEQILARAYAEARVLVTLDKDFGELAVVQSKPHAGIIRLVQIPARRQGAVCQALLTRYETELVGAIVTAYAERVRIRKAGVDEPAE